MRSFKSKNNAAHILFLVMLVIVFVLTGCEKGETMSTEDFKGGVVIDKYIKTYAYNSQRDIVVRKIIDGEEILKEIGVSLYEYYSYNIGDTYMGE